jgi:hypothetical protein
LYAHESSLRKKGTLSAPLTSLSLSLTSLSLSLTIQPIHRLTPLPPEYLLPQVVIVFIISGTLLFFAVICFCKQSNDQHSNWQRRRGFPR